MPDLVGCEQALYWLDIMVCFGGADLSTLYVTTARNGIEPEELDRWPLSGMVFAMNSNTRGLEEHRFDAPKGKNSPLPPFLAAGSNVLDHSGAAGTE